MADFMTELWNAVFEAGPTPTLLLATNVTFAALQMLLLAMLVATYSVHFVVLSALCGGLWASINWFAAELRTIQRAEQEKAGENPGYSTCPHAEISKAAEEDELTAHATSTQPALVDDKLTRKRNMQRSVEGLDSDWEHVEDEH